MASTRGRRRLLLGLAGLATAALAAGLAHHRHGRHNPGMETVSYKQTPQGTLALDIYRPAEPGPSRGALLFFFGGGWVAGDRRQFAPQADYFSRLGLVVVLADYRVAGRHGTGIPEAQEDAADSYRWLQKHAASMGLAPNAVAVAGGSSGGHLAACLATGCGTPAANPAPAALLLYNPVLDLPSASAALGFSAQELALIGALSPREQLQRSPGRRLCELHFPQLVLFGEEDPLLPQTQWLDCPGARDLQLLTWPDAGHGFFNRAPLLGETTAAAHRFLSDAGLLPATSGNSTHRNTTQ